MPPGVRGGGGGGGGQKGRTACIYAYTLTIHHFGSTSAVVSAVMASALLVSHTVNPHMQAHKHRVSIQEKNCCV